jgi:hypothetical protein
MCNIKEIDGRHTSCPYSTDMKINDYTYIDAADLP